MRYSTRLILLGIALIGSFSTQMVMAAEPVHIVSGPNPTLCLTMAGGRKVQGTPVTFSTCGPAEDQRFEFTAAHEIRVYHDMCLVSVGKGNPGDRIEIMVCNGDPRTKWTKAANSAIVGTHGLCLDIAGGAPAQVVEKTVMQLATCTKGSSPSQQWTMAKP